MSKEVRDIGASVRARLLQISKQDDQNYELVLTRYANERLLYRLAESEYAKRFVLKGAVLLMSLFNEPFRGTRDIDLPGHGDSDPTAVLEVFKDIFAIEEPDGVRFDVEGAIIGRIREDAGYGGLRIKTKADVGGAKVPISIDVGFGDATEPKPEILELPTLLDMPPVRLHGYARETVIAEKFQAMVALGLANSRMKDYYDVWLLIQSFEFDKAQLARAIAATFARRETPIPTELPDALTASFGADEAKQQLWEVFIRDVSPDPGPLQGVIETISGFLMPIATIAVKENLLPPN